jgi:hypothetical protein
MSISWKRIACRRRPFLSLLALLGFFYVFVEILAVRQAYAAVVTYQLVVDNTWSETTHPGAFPSDAHFSFLGGATHNSAVSFWSVGTLASPGIERMAETGHIDLLGNEVQAAITAGTAGGSLAWEHWFCPAATTNAACGPTTVQFAIDDAYSQVTLATMLGPSPDWFVGVSGLQLHDGADWLSQVIVDLVPYDGGTESAADFIMNGPDSDPKELISLITATSGQLVGPGSLGTMTFTLVPPSAVPLPAALPLFASALIVLGFIGYRRRTSRAA